MMSDALGPSNVHISLGGVARTKVLAVLGVGVSLIAIVLGFPNLIGLSIAALALSLAVSWQGLSSPEWAWRALGYLARSRVTALQTSSSMGQGTITWRGHRTFQWWSSAHRGRVDLRGRDQQEWSDVVAAMARMSLHGAHHWTWHAASGDAWLSGPAGALLPPTWQPATPHTSSVIPATGWLYETWSYLRGPHGFMSAWRLQDDSSFVGYLADLVHLDGVVLSVSATVLNSHASRRRVRRARHASAVDSAWRRRLGFADDALWQQRMRRSHDREQLVIANGALVELTVSFVVTGRSLDELRLNEMRFRDNARRRGLVIYGCWGNQARAVAASWPGSQR